MKTRDRFSDAAANARPYVERAVGDEELRENVKAAFQAAREVYDELIGGRGVTTVASRVATDKEIQEKLAATGFEVWPSHTPEEFAKYVTDQLVLWTGLIKAANIQPE